MSKALQFNLGLLQVFFVPQLALAARGFPTVATFEAELMTAPTFHVVATPYQFNEAPAIFTLFHLLTMCPFLHFHLGRLIYCAVTNVLGGATGLTANFVTVGTF